MIFTYYIPTYDHYNFNINVENNSNIKVIMNIWEKHDEILSPQMYACIQQRNIISFLVLVSGIQQLIKCGYLFLIAYYQRLSDVSIYKFKQWGNLHVFMLCD